MDSSAVWVGGVLMAYVGMWLYLAWEFEQAPLVEDECECPFSGQRAADEQCDECGAYCEIGGEE